MVIFPKIQGEFDMQPWESYQYRGIHRQVADLAMASGFRVVDLCEMYSAYEPRDVVLSSWDDHPTRLGHDLAARAIEAKLFAKKLVLSSKKQEPE